MKVLLFSSVLLSGLIAGLMYSYSCSVNIGLRVLQNNEYIKAMQSINRAILNPYFFISFIGLLILYPVTAYRLYTNSPDISFYLLLTATLFYFVGVFGITMLGNVPLNNLLDRFTVSNASPEEITGMRLAFEKPWNNYHTLRTVASIISFGLTILSLIKQKI